MNGPEQAKPATLRERLTDLAREAGGTHEVFRYDAGQSIKITVPGKPSVQASIDDGDMDDDEIVAFLRHRLTSMGLIGATKRRFALTYASGSPVTVLALDEEQAIKLVGRGEPDDIEIVP